MAGDGGRWHEVSRSEYAHEREGLERVKQLLPDRPPFHAWSNFEFRDRNGKWYEVDLLVLGQRRLHLVELKHYQGTLTGSAYRWRRNGRSEDSPLLLARRKAQRLRSVIVEEFRKLGRDAHPREVPYIAECIFLHAERFRCDLPSSDTTDLFGIDELTHESHLHGLSERLLEPPGAEDYQSKLVSDDARLLRLLFDRIGFVQRREREVGSWRLVGPPEAEGEGWQDWPAEQRVARDRARIRFFVNSPGTSTEDHARTRKLVGHEYALTRRLQHDALLHPIDLVEDELGVGLVYPDVPDHQRLDLWLADHSSAQSLPTQLHLIRLLAEGVAYAHRHHVVHRGLSPAAVLVGSEGDELTVKLGDWQAAGTDAPGTTTSGSASATRLLQILEGGEAPDRLQRQAEAYLAPEGRFHRDADRVRLDVFALGALAYLVVTGRPPASDRAELHERVKRDGGLDLAGDLPEVPPRLRRLLLDATRPVVSERLADVQSFVQRLSEVDRDGADVDATVADPLDAVPGTFLADRFELVRRMGSGSTAVGLLVADTGADGECRVLKVAKDDSAAKRLVDEAEVLRSLGRLRHRRIVRLAEDDVLAIGTRQALLLESAGEETLADALRERSRLSLDLLHRWGCDLLEALVALDKAGVDHRDIKPANLGVRKQRGDRAKHLVLFDFSLSRAGASAVEAGTPPYLDPFLGSGNRSYWDSAAERYAAAATLFQMATGGTPSFGDGLTDPSMLDDEATVEVGSFDPSLAHGLADFFRTALRRDIKQRHHTAAEMLDRWRAIFDNTPTTVPDDADARAEAATPDTALAEAGLSARALSALEPLHVQTVGELAGLDPGQLQITRVAAATRTEIHRLARFWRDRFGPQTGAPAQPTGAASEPGEGFSEVLADPEALANRLASAAPARSRTPTSVARLILGLDPEGEEASTGERDAPAPLPAFATHAEIAESAGITSGRVSQILTDLLVAWATETPEREALDTVVAAAYEVVSALGGLGTVEQVADQLAPDAPTDRQRRVVLGLLRCALERADHVERHGGMPSRLARRRRRRDGRVLLAATDDSGEQGDALLDAADPLGQRADELVDAAVESGDLLVPAARAADQLRAAWPAGSTPPDAGKLARIAAQLSTHAEVSRRGELHDRSLDPADAIRFALTGLAPSQRVGEREIVDWVRARFPEAEQVPGRPRLDALLQEAGLPLRWDGDAYATPSRPAGSSELASRVPTRVDLLATSPTTNRTDARLAESVSSHSFLALGVAGSRLDAAAEVLRARHAAVVVDVTAVLVDALRSTAESAGIPWDEVRAADAAEPASRPRQGLDALLKRSIPQVEQAIADAAEGAAGRPVVLIEAAPLARYGQVGVLAGFSDLTARRDHAIWLLFPQEYENAATLDGVPVPISHGGQLLRLDADWLHASTLEGEPA